MIKMYFLPMSNTKYTAWNAFADLKIQCKVKQDTIKN